MTVKELIVKLLDCDMNSIVSIVYPEDKLMAGNYYRYNQRTDFNVVDSASGVLIGIENDYK